MLKLTPVETAFLVTKISVKLPVVVYFHTDLDLKQHTGFEISYNTVPDAVGLGKVAKISSENLETDESSAAPVGLIVGLLIIILLAMSVIIFFLMKRNRKLKMESYVPTLELDDLGPTMAAPENIYEDLEVAQALIRTESQVFSLLIKFLKSIKCFSTVGFSGLNRTSKSSRPISRQRTTSFTRQLILTFFVLYFELLYVYHCFS